MKKKTLLLIVLTTSVLGLQAQPILETVADKANLRYGNTQIEMESHLEIPDGEEPLQRHLSFLLFGNESPSIKEAYDSFFNSWKGKKLNPRQEIGGLRIETIRMSICKEYEKVGRFACYRVKADLTPKKFDDEKANVTQKNLLNQFKTGVNAFFVYDLQKHEVMKLDQILVPAAYDKVTSSLGDELNLYTEDWCLLFSSAKGEGSFLIKATTEKYFTDYFKELIQWESSLKDCMEPLFLRGEKGKYDFFKKTAKFSFAAKGEPADTVRLNLTIAADGSVASADIISPPTDHDNEAMQLCRKMPKWRPAYKDGNAVSSNIEVSIPFMKEMGDQIPKFADDDNEFRRRLFEDLIIPSNVGLKEKVVLEIIIETDGSVTYVGTKNLANEYLKRQFIERLERMPKWKPGKKNGKPIRVKMSLPINLSFTDDPNYVPDY